MTKKDLAILTAAIMAAQVVKNEYHYGYNGRKSNCFYICSFTFHGAACKLEVAATDEEMARMQALEMAKKKYGARYARVITRKELDAPGLESQRHLLFWRDNIQYYEALKHYQELNQAVPPYRDDPKAFRRADDKAYHYYRRYCPNINGYKLDKLLEVYAQVPLSWLKHAGVCNKAA